jgi:hypothetical protein
MEATCSSETSVIFQQTSLRYIPEDRTLLLIILVLIYLNVILRFNGAATGKGRFTFQEFQKPIP